MSKPGVPKSPPQKKLEKKSKKRRSKSEVPGSSSPSPSPPKSPGIPDHLEPPQKKIVFFGFGKVCEQAISMLLSDPALQDGIEIVIDTNGPKRVEGYELDYNAHHSLLSHYRATNPVSQNTLNTKSLREDPKRYLNAQVYVICGGITATTLQERLGQQTPPPREDLAPFNLSFMTKYGYRLTKCLHKSNHPTPPLILVVTNPVEHCASFLHATISRRLKSKYQSEKPFYIAAAGVGLDSVRFSNQLKQLLDASGIFQHNVHDVKANIVGYHNPEGMVLDEKSIQLQYFPNNEWCAWQSVLQTLRHTNLLSKEGGQLGEKFREIVDNALAAARTEGYTIINLQGKGSSYGPGTHLALIAAAFTSPNVPPYMTTLGIFSQSMYSLTEGPAFVGVPVTVSQNNIVESLTPELITKLNPVVASMKTTLTIEETVLSDYQERYKAVLIQFNSPEEKPKSEDLLLLARKALQTIEEKKELSTFKVRGEKDFVDYMYRSLQDQDKIKQQSYQLAPLRETKHQDGWKFRVRGNPDSLKDTFKELAKSSKGNGVVFHSQ